MLITKMLANNVSPWLIIGVALITLILGLVALFNPLKMESSTKKIDLPFLVAVTGILMLFGFDMFLNVLCVW